MVGNQNLIQEEIERRLILVMLANIHSASVLLCAINNVKIRTYKIRILPVVLYGCEF
jgi:hypothetical protein